MSKITLTDISHPGDNTVVVAVNNNNTAIRQALENTLSRDGTSPNEMEATLDMNSERIINLPSPVSSTEPVRLGDMSSFGVGGTFTPLPAGGTAGQGLVKNSGTNYDVSWDSVSATPGGSNTQLQYNNAGSFAGITNVTTNGTNITLGTPTSGTLTNCTGLPVSTGVSGLGTGIAAALAIATGSAGAPVLFNGAGGTPSSMTGTNITNLNATNLASGTVPAARMPALTGDATMTIGTTATTVLTSNGVSLNYGAVSTTTALTVTSGSGTITTASASLRYQIRGKQVWFTLSVTITTNGTGATNVSVLGLPWTFASNCLVPGRATTGSGKMLQAYGVATSNAITIWNYDNTYPATSGEVLVVTGTIEQT